MTFTGAAWFNEATFTGVAQFVEATFTRDAWFRNATFTGDAWFDAATFTGATQFDGATFTEDAWFRGATFTDAAWFRGATFTEAAWFNEATFTRAAWFDGATFTGDARFGGSRWRTLGWSRTVWETASVESAGLVAVEILLDRAVFEQPVRLELVAGRVSMERMRATERLHLVVAGAHVSLEDADFAEGSLIDAAPVQVPTTVNETSGNEVQEQQLQESGTGRWVFIAPFDISALDPEQRLSRSLMYASLFLEADLSTALNHTPTASVTSLRRTHVAGTTLSGMDLRACTFTGADGLDKLVIAGDDILTNHRGEKDMMRAWPARGRKWWRTSRRVLYDEHAVRQLHPAASDTAGTGETTLATDELASTPPVPGRLMRWQVTPESQAPGALVEPAGPGELAATPTAPLTYRSVSATYRSLRKALEDSKDEPGAADFYYGEMTMRRLAATPLSAERWLLTLYWLIAGYGLRAWRALAILVVVIAVAGWCFTNDAWAVKTVTKTPTSVNLNSGVITSSASTADGLSLMRSWLFAAQEAVVPFRPAGLSGVTLTSWGHLIDIAVRILGPVMLALAILSVRNRTKR
ncbi:pentapeptide repeat-containing protein [Gordonia sp. NPDC127522]|uniref:pentapeptide repeat-containing protein n=1 Tax=Gordonia sp. NPDC127522 TaxID=3345390 RepID=UPI00363FCAF6